MWVDTAFPLMSHELQQSSDTGQATVNNEWYKLQCVELESKFAYQKSIGRNRNLIIPTSIISQKSMGLSTYPSLKIDGFGWIIDV